MVIMSTSELTAHRIFDSLCLSYPAESLDADVRRHLAVLLLQSDMSDVQSAPGTMMQYQYTQEELCNRVAEADAEYFAGKGRPIEELFTEIEKDFPELCK